MSVRESSAAVPATDPSRPVSISIPPANSPIHSKESSVPAAVVTMNAVDTNLPSTSNEELMMMSGSSTAAPSSSSTTHAAAAKNTAKNAVASVRRASSGVVVVAMCYFFWMATKSEGFSNVFFYHPTAMTISFIGLMPEIIGLKHVISRQRNVADRERMIDRHLYLSLVMKFLSLIGFIAITINKNRKGKPHYATWHGKLGLLTIIVLLIQVMVGLVYHFRWFASSSAQNRLKLRKIHKYAGIALLTVGSACMWLGMQTNYFQKDISSNNLVTVILGSSTMAFSLIAYKYE